MDENEEHKVIRESEESRSSRSSSSSSKSSSNNSSGSGDKGIEETKGDEIRQSNSPKANKVKELKMSMSPDQSLLQSPSMSPKKGGGDEGAEEEEEGDYDMSYSPGNSSE